MLLLFQGVVDRPLDANRYQAWCPHGGANRTFGLMSIYQSSFLSNTKFGLIQSTGRANITDRGTDVQMKVITISQKDFKRHGDNKLGRLYTRSQSFTVLFVNLIPY